MRFVWGCMLKLLVEKIETFVPFSSGGRHCITQSVHVCVLICETFCKHRFLKHVTRQLLVTSCDSPVTGLCQYLPSAGITGRSAGTQIWAANTVREQTSSDQIKTAIYRLMWTPRCCPRKPLPGPYTVVICVNEKAQTSQNLCQECLISSLSPQTTPAWLIS